jgi:hypothetical protein
MEEGLVSVLSCPQCGYRKEEIMPGDSCQYFYECEGCRTVLRPQEGHCCVFCSYGTAKCPPVQSGNCCQPGSQAH